MVPAVRPVAASVLALLGLLAGCATRPAVLAPSLGTEAPVSNRLVLTGVPFYPQQEYHCGPAALATVLGASGVRVAPAALVDKVYLPERRGSLQLELVAATRGYGRVAYQLSGGLPELLAELSAGRPVLVMQNVGLRSRPAWHYAVVVGFDTARDELLLRSGTTRELRVPAHKFIETWADSGHWALVALRPEEAPAAPDPDIWLQAIAALESRQPPALLETAYTTYLGVFAGQPVAWFGLANAQVARDEYLSAERIYRRLLAADPRSAAVHNNLAHLLAQRGCSRQALAQIETGLKAVPGDSPFRGMLATTRREIIKQPPQAAEGCLD